MHKRFFTFNLFLQFSLLVVPGAKATSPSECEYLIPLTIMVGYNFETNCSVNLKSGVYDYEITLIKPYFLEGEDWGVFIGACVGCVGEVSRKTSWKSKYLNINANGARWRITTADCREAMRKTSGEATSVGTYIVNRLEKIE
ncbi:hypothetical protein KKA00_07355 [bacterium]|nr:hypothetical protein [bacterium]MBU1652021.1 hypothetical protein [bacterium]